MLTYGPSLALSQGKPNSAANMFSQIAAREQDEIKTI